MAPRPQPARFPVAPPDRVDVHPVRLHQPRRAFGDALARALGEDAERLRVLAGDRAKGFAWNAAADRVWALHAEL